MKEIVLSFCVDHRVQYDRCRVRGEPHGLARHQRTP